MWGRLAPELVASRVLTKLDETTLGITACAIADYLDAREIPDRGTLRDLLAVAVVQPELGARALEALISRARGSTAAYRAALAGLAELGATPSARSRVKAAAHPSKDPLREFLARARGGAA